MKLGKVKRSTDELIDNAVARQHAWMSKMRARSKAVVTYLSKHTVKTVQTLVSVTPLVNKLQKNEEVKQQSFWKKLGYLLSVFFVLAIILFVVWALFNMGGCEKSAQTTTNEPEVVVVEETVVVEEPVAAPEPAPEPIPAPVVNEKEYTVKAGDNLWTIAGKFMGDNYKYPELAKFNNIGNPDVIEPGQKIIVPVK